MQISSIAILLCASFALILSGKMAKAQWSRGGLVVLGALVLAVVLFERGNEPIPPALIAFPLLSVAISNLIATLMWRKRVKPPCVRVNTPRQDDRADVAMGVILLSFLAPLGIYLTVTGSFHSFGRMLFWGLMTFALVISIVLSLFDKIEICGNGLLNGERLHSWEEYESFTWESETKCGSQLLLVSKSWLFRTTRLLVSPGDREVVQRILEANLPDQSSFAEYRNTRRGPKWKCW